MEWHLPRPSITGGEGIGRVANQGSRVEIGEMTGEFPAIADSKGNITQTTFSLGRGNATANLNANSSTGNFGIYEIRIDGQLYNRPSAPPN